jgi:YebC/PmpR family DNA-binding regulatory protein
MAGHSQFKNIMYRKGAQDAKRAKIFAKIIRELTVAAKSGLPDPNSNPRLRAALASAREANMPKDNIDRALKRALGGEDTTSYEEVRYEGYGPGRVAIIVEVLTDNRNRAASEVRSAFTKYGGNLGETGSVSYQFDHLGFIIYDKAKITFDKLFDIAVDAGANNVEENGSSYEVVCSKDDFAHVRDTLMKQLGEPKEAKIIWRPTSTVPLDEEHAKTLLKLLDVLEDSDDVQTVFANFEISDDIMQKLTAI